MDALGSAVDAMARDTGFSGVIRVDRDGEPDFERAFGFAHRALEVPNRVDTQLAIASGSKGFTALAVVRLIEQGTLELTTTARSVLGGDLPLIRPDVTVEHLLAHRSGIGDYLDEEAGGEITDYAMRVPVHELETTEQFLAVLDGFPTAFEPDERFAYCNGGFMILALIAERGSGTPFHELIASEVTARAGMVDTAYLRSDALPGRAALNYLTDDPASRTNVLHLPVRGNGDGGIFTTVADLSAFWPAFFGGRIVSPDWVSEMVRRRSEAPQDSARYGLGFWVYEQSDAVWLTGYDAGVSFRSAHDPGSGLTHTVIANTSEGAWPITRLLDEQLGLV
jgi:CubicO group peptidase (beta-lactamase class C family)